jgi:hypothetical protein
MVVLCPLGEQFRVVVIGRRGSVISIRKLLRNDVDVVEGHFPLIAQSEADLALHLGVDGLVKTDYNVFSGLPFEPSLSGDDVVGVHLITSQFFRSE